MITVEKNFGSLLIDVEIRLKTVRLQLITAEKAIVNNQKDRNQLIKRIFRKWVLKERECVKYKLFNRQ